jgi:hypothetical protein
MAMIALSLFRTYARRFDSGDGPETAIEVTWPSGKSDIGPMSTHCQSSAWTESATAKPTTGTRIAAVMTPPVTIATPLRNFVRVM